MGVSQQQNFSWVSISKQEIDSLVFRLRVISLTKSEGLAAALRETATALENIQFFADDGDFRGELSVSASSISGRLSKLIVEPSAGKGA